MAAHHTSKEMNCSTEELQNILFRQDENLGITLRKTGQKDESFKDRLCLYQSLLNAAINCSIFRICVTDLKGRFFEKSFFKKKKKHKTHIWTR